ncbi:MAG: Bax inhibitor-1/YccA family protein, partial [Bdellovibrionales bacterium]|nr:Bax inhibitor-1/YccA family protein [Bdellovibrionales bacterium]
NKSGILISLTVLSATFTWNNLMSSEQPQLATIPLIVALIAGLVCSLVIVFKPTLAPVLSPVYAILEGGILGALTLVMEAVYPGIALQAVTGTFGVFALMLITYRTGLIKVTEKFRSILSLAIGGVFFIYLASWITSLFGFSLPYLHSGGPIGIGFSLIVCGIAAFSLLMDFDLIEKGSQQQAPRYMEWYAAFSLLVTLVWLYIEVLRLLGKSRR